MSTEAARPPATQTAKYMTLLAALLGWMFDGFEMGLFPLIGQPALADLLGPAGAKDAGMWFGAIIAVFLVGAASGGVLFGWLGDKIGRVRAMSLSIFTYAIFTGLCGFATDAWHIAALRFIASLGMGGEWSLGVALVNEIWPGKSRAFIAGLIGAAANVGFLMVALLSMGLAGFIGGVEGLLKGIGCSDATTAKLLANSAWRFLMISGAFPALLIFFIRLFVPESEKWEEEKAKGATSHWSNADLIGVLIGCAAAVGIIYVWSPAAANISGLVATLVTVVGLGVALVGYLYPVRQYLTRAIAAGSLTPESQGAVVKSMLLGAGLAGVALLGTWGSIQWAPRWAGQLQPDTKEVKYYAKEKTQIATALGPLRRRSSRRWRQAGLAGALPTRSCALARLCRRCISTNATRPSIRASWWRRSWPGASRRRFMVSFRCISQSCSPRRCGPRDRASRSTSGASSRPSAACKPPP